MANPALNEKFLNKIHGLSDTSKMTIEGTVNKTGLLLLLVLAGAAVGWQSANSVLLIISMVFTLVVSLIIIFKPQQAPLLSPMYALSEGYLLGAISVVYARVYPGIISNAMILTLSCLGLMLGLYKFKVIQVTDKFRSVMMVATMAVGVTYLVSMILGFFGTQIPMIHEGTPVGIAFSGIVVCVAAFNLLLDFDMIEKAQAMGAPKYMEWYCSFATLVTIVWLYLEILRLLSKLNKK